MLCGRARWLVSECRRISGGRDSVDVNCVCPSRVLESQDDQSVCVAYRSSLAGVTSPDTVICWSVLSGALSARPIAVRFRKTGGLGRHDCCDFRLGCSRRDAHSIRENAFACLEYAWTYRHHFCCLECAPVWLKRLAIDARAAGTSTESSPDISGTTYYRVTRIDLRPADPSAN